MIAVAHLTPGLAALLRTRNDDGSPELHVEGIASLGLVRILRADGSELSDFEVRHVRATLAAHAVEPL